MDMVSLRYYKSELRRMKRKRALLTDFASEHRNLISTNKSAQLSRVAIKTLSEFAYRVVCVVGSGRVSFFFDTLSAGQRECLVVARVIVISLLLAVH